MVQSGYFYPASGVRVHLSGAFRDMGYIGYFWQSALSGIYGIHMEVNSSLVRPSSIRERAFGMPVRCVQNLLLVKKSNLLFG